MFSIVTIIVKIILYEFYIKLLLPYIEYKCVLSSDIALSDTAMLT